MGGVGGRWNAYRNYNNNNKMSSRIYLLTESRFCETWSGLRSEGLKSCPLSWAGAGSIRGSAPRLLTQWLTPWNSRRRANQPYQQQSARFLRRGFSPRVLCVRERVCVDRAAWGGGPSCSTTLTSLAPYLYLYPRRSSPSPHLLLSFTCCLKRNRPDTTVMVHWAEKRSYLLIVAKMSRQE